MSNFNRNSLILILLFLCTAFILQNMRQTRKLEKLDFDLQKIPLVIAGWKGEDLKLPSYVYEILETKNVLMREYKGENGDSLVLAVVVSERNRGSFHPPEICYAGSSGVEFLEKRIENIPLNNNETLKVNKLLMKSSDVFTTAWYWFLAGDNFVANYYQQQLRLFLDALSGNSVQGAMIRVSVQGNNELLQNRSKAFIKLLIPYMKTME